MKNSKQRFSEYVQINHKVLVNLFSYCEPEPATALYASKKFLQFIMVSNNQSISNIIHWNTGLLGLDDRSAV